MCMLLPNYVGVQKHQAVSLLGSNKVGHCMSMHCRSLLPYQGLLPVCLSGYGNKVAVITKTRPYINCLPHSQSLSELR